MRMSSKLKMALVDARLNPDTVDYVNAHGRRAVGILERDA
jgi:3-oxoacyl-(acyl-carrier-protein) synthase